MEATLGDKLVDQHGGFNFKATTNEPNNVLVDDLRLDDDFICKLLGLQHITTNWFLYCDEFAINNPLVNFTKATFSN